MYASKGGRSEEDVLSSRNAVFIHHIPFALKLKALMIEETEVRLFKTM
jgi:hypothetical protein